MLTDIFSTFDPATRSLFTALPTPVFWISNLTLLSLLTSSYWISPSRLTQLLIFPKDTIFSQVNRTYGANINGFSIILTSMFILIIVTNLTGLIPYVFRLSSHLFFTLTFALPIWLSLLISGAAFFPTAFLAGLLPGGAPRWLNPFLVLIETTRIGVRPITLSFRLAANIRAGHIVLALIGIYTASALFTSITASLILLSIQTMYIIFELGICLIQAYIFCLLLSLYSDDHPSLH